MAKLPRDTDPRRVVAAFLRLGWEIRSSKGGHVRLVKADRPGIVLSIPFHAGRGVSPGVLRETLRIAGLSVQEFLDLL